MQPINYMLDVAQPLQMALAGYQQGRGMRAQEEGMQQQRRLMEMQEMEFQQQQQALQAQQQRAAEVQDMMGQFAEDLEAGNVDMGYLNRLVIAVPEMAEMAQQMYQQTTEPQQRGMLDRNFRLLNLIRNAPDQVVPMLEQQAQAYENAGDPEQAKLVRLSIEEYKTRPAALESGLLADIVLNPLYDEETMGELIQPAGLEDTEAIRTFKALAEFEGLVPGTPEYAEAARQQRQRTSGTTVNVPVSVGGELSPGFKKQDELFAQVAVDWKTGGGTDALKQVGQLTDVIGRIDAGEDVSGGIQGVTPDIVRAFTNPGALDAQETVEEVVQRNLRVILGAQFTAKEGEQLIRRAFNPRLRPEINRRRLQRLLTQMEIAAEQKQGMVDYFDENGTLRGYSGRQPTLNDFYSAIGTEAEQAQGLPVVDNPAAYAALPSGAEFVDASGRKYRKP